MTTCSVISPSYFCTKKERTIVEKNLSKIGFSNTNFISSRIFFKKWAGSPIERLDNFANAWNSGSKVIMCCKGGSGVSQFLPLLDKRKLKKEKLFVGYSDLTFLLNYINKRLKIITFHGPHLSKELDSKTISSLMDALKMNNYGIKFEQKNIFFNSQKKILKGKIIGGNLERLVENLIYMNLDFKDKIVFLEDVGLNEYKLFNLLCTLRNYPGFKPKAILFGDLGIKDKKLIQDMIKYLFFDVPIIVDLPFGHNLPNITIPIGADCEVDFNNKKIRFLFPIKHKKYAIEISK